MNRIKRLVTAVTVAVLFALILSCGAKRDSLGSQDKIIIIADSTQWVEIEEDVIAVMGKSFFTPQPEPVFELLHKTPKDLNKLMRFPNLLIIGTLDLEGDMQDLLGQLLSDESVTRVQQDSAFLFNKMDAWARNQMLAIVVAEDVPALQQNLEKYGDRIFNLFDEDISANVFSSLYVHYEQKDISKSLMEKYGWSVRVQHDYNVVIDSSEINYVWLRRMGPQRWLSVYWEPVDDPSLLSKAWMLEKRSDVIGTAYDGDYVYEDETIKILEKVVDFNDRYAIRLDGVWQNEKHTMGGLFRSYGFYNESDSRLYLIDLAVYAPGQRKYQYLRQLDGIVSTFKTKAEM